jgi:hypothetical protein
MKVGFSRYLIFMNFRKTYNHITCFKPFVQGRLKGVMLYGYMFLRHLPPKGGFCGCSDATCRIHSLGCAG